MTTVTATRVLRVVALLGALAGAPLPQRADRNRDVGETGRGGTPGVIEMTVEACCGGSGRRITYGGGSEAR